MKERATRQPKLYNNGKILSAIQPQLDTAVLPAQKPIPEQKPVQLLNISIATDSINGDLLNQKVDAIVNAANVDMNLGRKANGISGVIHKDIGADQLAAAMVAAAKKKNQNNPFFNLSGNHIDVGQAVTTKVTDIVEVNQNRKIKANYIIHTVGPDCTNKQQYNDRQNLIKAAYINAFKEALANNVKTIAVPLISSGIFRGKGEQEFKHAEMAKNIAEVIFAYSDKFAQINVCGLGQEPLAALLGTEITALQAKKATAIQSEATYVSNMQDSAVTNFYPAPLIATKPQQLQNLKYKETVKQNIDLFPSAAQIKSISAPEELRDLFKEQRNYITNTIASAKKDGNEFIHGGSSTDTKTGITTHIWYHPKHSKNDDPDKDENSIVYKVSADNKIEVIYGDKVSDAIVFMMPDEKNGIGAQMTSVVNGKHTTKGDERNSLVSSTVELGAFARKERNRPSSIEIGF